MTRFSDDEIENMRGLRAQGMHMEYLALLFDTSSSYVYKLCSGKARPHAPGPITTNRRYTPAYLLSEEERRDIRRRYLAGERGKGLTLDYLPASRTTVMRVARSQVQQRSRLD